MSRAVSTARLAGRPFALRFVERLARGRPMGVGAYMFVAHRLTAVAITVYLYVHLITLGSVLKGREDFDSMMALMNGTTVRVLELGLVALVLFHTLNGLRLSLLAFFPRASQRWLSYGVITASVLAVILSLPLFLE